jgi:hypothetical protein
VEYRVDGGAVCETAATAEPGRRAANARLFRAFLPGRRDGVVEYLPVLRFAGQPISLGIDKSSMCGRYRIARPASPAGTAPPRVGSLAGTPRWEWSAKFLGALTADVSKEVVGETPDGFRIDWHVQKGTFVGPASTASCFRARPTGCAFAATESRS